MSITVTTQQALDDAIAAGHEDIVIDSPRGVWVTVRASDSATVYACGSATVYACGSAAVRACGGPVVVDGLVDGRDPTCWMRPGLWLWVWPWLICGRSWAPHRSARPHVLAGLPRMRGEMQTAADPQTWCDYHGVPTVDWWGCRRS